MALATISGEIQAQPINDNFSFINQNLGFINQRGVNLINPPAPLVAPIGDLVADDTAAIQAILNNYKNIIVPEKNFRITSTLVLPQAITMCGYGEASYFYADFTGGPVLEYQGGEPIIIRDLKIARNLSITPVDGDSGIEIGLISPWAGRGEISNLFITGHYDGFKWKGGTLNTIRNINSYENKRHGFFGINPRGQLISCLAQYNEGSGYYFYADGVSETGIELILSGTFANQEFGLLLDGNSASANVWGFGFTSSFDGRGGIYCEKEYIQLSFVRTLIEYAGYATNFKPLFTTYNNSLGIYLGSLVSIANFTHTQVIHNKGTGILLDGCEDVNFSGTLEIYDNGRGLLGGNNQDGLAVQNTTNRFYISNLTTRDSGANQISDIAINTNNNVGVISNSQINSEFLVGTQTGVKFKNVESSATNNVASVSVVQLPLSHNFINITGTTNIDAISESWKGRQVTLLFQDVLSVTDGNNLMLSSAFSTTNGDTLTLIYDGANWYEISRSTN